LIPARQDRKREGDVDGVDGKGDRRKEKGNIGDEVPEESGQ